MPGGSLLAPFQPADWQCVGIDGGGNVPTLCFIQLNRIQGSLAFSLVSNKQDYNL